MPQRPGIELILQHMEILEMSDIQNNMVQEAAWPQAPRNLKMLHTS